MIELEKPKNTAVSPNDSSTPCAHKDEVVAPLAAAATDGSDQRSDTSSPTTTTNSLVKDSNQEIDIAAAHTATREHLEGPPPLHFDLRHHKVSISIFTFLCLAECCLVPLGLYYGLSKGTNMRSGIYFAIITSLFGFVSGYEFGIRGWRLIQACDEFRPLNDSPRFWGFDSTQYVLITPFTVMTIILIIFSIPHYPSVRALALPMPVGMIVTGFIFVINGWAAQRRWRLRYFRLSSHDKNSICPPLTFCALEDICAVDGKGGKKYRQEAMARYNASPRFRSLLMQLLWFWSIPAILLGAAMIAVIYVTSNDVAYGVGWGGPTLWIAVWTWITILWAQRALRIEKETWVPQHTQLA